MGALCRGRGRGRGAEPVVRNAVLLTAEILCALVALLGVALVYVPAALVLGGVLGILALERRQAVPPPATRKEVAR